MGFKRFELSSTAPRVETGKTAAPRVSVGVKPFQITALLPFAPLTYVPRTAGIMNVHLRH